MELIKNAITAGVPVLQLQTTDVVNVVDILETMLHRPVFGIDYIKGDPDGIQKHGLYYIIGGVLNDAFMMAWYNKLLAKEATLLCINPEKVRTSLLDGRAFTVPKSYLYDKIREATVAEGEPSEEDKKAIDAIMLALGGSSVRESTEIMYLTMEETSELTAKGIASTRRKLFKGGQGLFPIAETSTPYVPDMVLADYAKREKHFFLNEDDVRLRPRGILLDGSPGTGKSSGAKWLADQWGVAIYRLSIPDAKEMWVGNSEGNLRAALQALDEQEPCCVLIDEVEKAFGGINRVSDGGTTTGMLSGLLWWLQEHTSRVFTIMTTNNAEAIPPELKRPGRIDEVFKLGGLIKADAKNFIKAICPSYGIKPNDVYTEKVVKEAFGLMTGSHHVTPSALIQALTLTIKNDKAANLST